MVVKAYRGADVVLKTGDTGPTLERVLLNSANDPVDLTGVTVRFIAKMRAGTPLIDKAATVVQSGATDVGKVRVTWAAGDLVTPGFYDAEFEVVGAQVTSYPNNGYLLMRVTGQLDA